MNRFSLLMVIVLASFPGFVACMSKSRARREAKVAFQAGQLQSPEHAKQVATTLLVRGQVRTPVVPWHPDMTLSAALLEAGYQGRTDPHRITLTRQGVVYVVDIRRLLKGLDNPAVLPGDLIELQ